MIDPRRGMDLAIFDKDGTLIGFDHMWARAGGDDGRVIGVLTGVGTRDDLEPLADLVLGSVEQLRIA